MKTFWQNSDFDGTLSWPLICASYQNQLLAWMNKGEIPDSPLLRSFIRGDLQTLLGRTEMSILNNHEFRALCTFFHLQMPPTCWGRDRCVSDWPLYIQARARQEAAHAQDSSVG